MSESTKITIVTITYNSEKTIERTIQSIISQNYNNMEYWIIDGVSKDHTMELVKKYAQKYSFIKYSSEPDRGISDAFNKGIGKATGELIGLINSDDQLAEGALVAVDKTFAMTGADVIYGDTIVNDIANGLCLLKQAGNPKQLKYDMPFIHQSCFIRKLVYDQVGGYSENYKICMDYDMLARIFNRGYKFANANKILSIFQYGGTSCQHPIKTINEDMRIASKYGLNAGSIIVYKIKHVPINFLKLLLSKLKVWGWVYRRFKSKSILEEEL